MEQTLASRGNMLREIVTAVRKNLGTHFKTFFLVQLPSIPGAWCNHVELNCFRPYASSLGFPQLKHLKGRLW